MTIAFLEIKFVFVLACYLHFVHYTSVSLPCLLFPVIYTFRFFNLLNVLEVVAFDPILSAS